MMGACRRRRRTEMGFVKKMGSDAHVDSAAHVLNDAEIAAELLDARPCGFRPIHSKTNII
ncbi:hypothetical protein V2J09_022545 [Rumex salicifolius]